MFTFQDGFAWCLCLLH